MKAVFKLAWHELWKRKACTLLLLLVCLTAMGTVVSAATNATAQLYQQKLFARSIGAQPAEILHLHYRTAQETQAFANQVYEYRQALARMPGVKNAGQFDACGISFQELRGNVRYREINRRLHRGEALENHPDRVQMLYTDEALLPLVKNGVCAYEKASPGNLPLYASEVFRQILPLGTTLTDERTGTRYEVTGYLPEQAQWFDENDLIRFPMVSLRGWFAAPFDEQSQTDVLTQLSTLHNTYVIAADDVQADVLKAAVEECARGYGLDVQVQTLADEQEQYRAETQSFCIRQAALALFLTAMAVSTITASFTAHTIVRQGQYGVWLASGFTRGTIAGCIVMEMLMLLIPSAWIVWCGRLARLLTSEDIGIALFREVLLAAHVEFTLAACTAAAAGAAFASALLPVVRVFRYEPCELIGGKLYADH